MRNMSRPCGKTQSLSGRNRRADRPFWASLTLYFDRRALWPLHFHSMFHVNGRPCLFPLGDRPMNADNAESTNDGRNVFISNSTDNRRVVGIPWNGGIGGMTTLKYFWNRARNWKITLRIRRTEGELVHTDLIMEISPKVGVFDCSFFQFCHDI